MRSALALLPVTLLAGACASDTDVGFSLRAVLDAETSGVRILDDGSIGHAAMIDQLCTFDVEAGSVIDDVDLGAGQEVLLDATGQTALAKVADSVHRVGPTGEVESSLNLRALDARLYGSQTVALVEHPEGCAVAWIDEQVNAWAVPGTSCLGDVGFDVDRGTGAAWLADGDSLTRISPDGQFTRIDDAGADLVVWDASTGGAIIGARGEGWVQAVRADGEATWTRSFDGGLTDLDTAGSAELVAVMAAQDGAGALEVVSAPSGDLTHRFRLPEPAGLAFSSEGRDLGLVTDDSVYLYDVETDLSLVDTPSRQGASRVDPWMGMQVGAGGSSTATAAVGTAIAVLLIVD